MSRARSALIRTPFGLRSKATVLVAVAVAVLVGGGVGTFSYFVATTSNAGNAVSSGTVALSDNDSGQSLFSLSDMNPGESDTRCIKVTYDGSLASRVRLYGTTAGTGLDPYTSVTVTRGTQSGTPAPRDCTGFTADSSTYVSGQAAGVVYAGTLQDFPDSYAAGISDPESGSPENWTTGESHAYKIQVTVGDEPSATAKNASQTFTWEAQSLDGYQGSILSTSDLVSYWRLGETSGTSAKDAMSSNNGTYTGGVTLGQTGALTGDTDKAASFDGTDDRVEVPDAANLDLGDGPFTLELWMKRSAFNLRASLISKGFGTYHLMVVHGDVIEFGKKDVTGIVTSTVAITDTSWHHVVVTRNGTANTKLYIDGVDRTGGVTPTTLANNSDPMLIGHGEASFPGSIDEVAIYDTVLSAGEVKSHYEAGQ
jgi:Concanavalin A-like lectin/glucanases superfamily/Camelysin metallo-endopeptidase